MRLSVMLTLVAASIFLAACLLDTPTPPATGTSESAPTATPAEASSPIATPRLNAQGNRNIKQFSSPPLMAIDPNEQFTATIRTNHGPITVELFASQAPVTVNNFVFLARQGFYDGVIFHRVIPGFMIQGGDPTGTGTSGPGYQFQDEFVPELVFDQPGILAMANSGPNTNGSQFFITVAPTPHLNGGHSIFGRVVSGQAVADTISTVRSSAGDRPIDPVTIQGIDITMSGG